MNNVWMTRVIHRVEVLLDNFSVCSTQNNSGLLLDIVVHHCFALLCNITSVKQMVFGEGYIAIIPEFLILVSIFITRVPM